jgi:RNA polymerase sigma-70 factor (ECF subfamily)
LPAEVKAQDMMPLAEKKEEGMEETGREAPLYVESPEIRPFTGPVAHSETETAHVEESSLHKAPKPFDKAQDKPEIGDVELLRKAVAGNGKAFHELVNRHGQLMYRLAVRLIGNATDAEDVVQEAFAGAFRSMAKFEARASVKTWLTRFLVVQVAKLRRDRRRRPMDSIETTSASMGTPGGSASVDHRIDMQAALEKLSREHREVLVLREFEQMSYEEIAAVLDVPRGTVESRLHRARAELREKLKAYLP